MNLEEATNECKEYKEEYGVFENKLVTRQEYDDGSAIINNKPKRIDSVKLRTRNLTKYNFIIAAKYSPYNCREFEMTSVKMLTDLLKGEVQFPEFVLYMKKFPRYKYF